MKKLLYVAVLLISISATAANNPGVNEKVLRAFKETFTEAKNVNWNETGSACQADFTVGEIRMTAIFENDGRLLQTIRYYDEKNLPAKVLAKLKSKHPGKEVTGVTETTTDDAGIVYNIVLRDEKNIYWVKADPYGNIELTKKMKRGDIR